MSCNGGILTAGTCTSPLHPSGKPNPFLWVISLNVIFKVNSNVWWNVVHHNFYILSKTLISSNRICVFLFWKASNSEVNHRYFYPFNFQAWLSYSEVSVQSAGAGFEKLWETAGILVSDPKSHPRSTQDLIALALLNPAIRVIPQSFPQNNFKIFSLLYFILKLY